MECVSSVSFFILVNGAKTKHFQPSKGIRQSDPLSPYLFILCQDVLSRLIERKFLAGNLCGVKMNINGLAFTHVMYADDIMLFGEANCRDMSQLDFCLEKYCSWYGQLINREKSSIIFSKLVSRERRREIKLLLQMNKV